MLTRDPFPRAIDKVLYWAFSLCELHTQTPRANYKCTESLPSPDCHPSSSFYGCSAQMTQISLNSYTGCCLWAPQSLWVCDAYPAWCLPHKCGLSYHFLQKRSPWGHAEYTAGIQTFVLGRQMSEWRNEVSDEQRPHVHSFLSNKRFSLTIHCGFSFTFPSLTLYLPFRESGNSTVLFPSHSFSYLHIPNFVL